MRDENYYTAVLIDDEKPALEVLKYLISANCPNIKVTGCFQDPEQGRNFIMSENPHLAFVDIKMNHINGLQFIESIHSRKTKFIFTTAYHEFALDAWKTKAISYLLKPIDPQDLTDAMAKVKILDWEEPTNPDAFLSLGTNSIQASNILSIEANGSYSKVKLIDRSEILISRNLKGILPILPEKEFYRIHRSHIININHIASVNSKDRSVTLAGNMVYEISERKFIEFINRIKGNAYGRN